MLFLLVLKIGAEHRQMLPGRQREREWTTIGLGQMKKQGCSLPVLRETGLGIFNLPCKYLLSNFKLLFKSVNFINVSLSFFLLLIGML